MAGTENRWMYALRTDRVWQIMAVNLAVFLLLHLLSLVGVSDAVLAWMFAMPASLRDFILCPWTSVTYMFTQWDFFHLIFNMLWLWTFGLILTRLATPSFRIVVAYVAGGLAGAVIWLFLGLIGVAHGILLGSSAAVLSVIGFTAIAVGQFQVQLMFFGTIKVKWLALAVIVLCVLADGSSQGVPTMMTHIAGACMGVFYALALQKGLLTSRAPRMKFNKPKSNPGYSEVRRPMRRGLDATEQAQLDAILMKVKQGGYTALTPEEKSILFNLSSKIK